MDIFTSQHLLYAHEGIPFIEYTYSQEGMVEDLPPRVRSYYDAYLTQLDRLCRERLLPQRVAAYVRNTDPRKRFFIRKSRISLTLHAEISPPYIRVTRTLLLQEGNQTKKQTTLDVFSSKSGRLYPQKKEKRTKHGRTTRTHAGRFSIFGKRKSARRPETLS